MVEFRALLIEDDPVIAKTLAMSLPFQGFEVSVCDNGQDGLLRVRNEPCDIVLLDVNLPDGSGFEVCRSIRRFNTRLPIVMLTAQTEEQSAVTGIGCGADDYIRKPCGLQELTARMRRLLKKVPAIDVFGGLRIDADNHKAWANTQPLELRAREFALLLILVRRKGAVISRQDILDALDTNAEIYDRTLDSHFSHLRKKLKTAGASEQIVSVYNVGYRLELPPL